MRTRAGKPCGRCLTHHRNGVVVVLSSAQDEAPVVLEAELRKSNTAEVRLYCDLNCCSQLQELKATWPPAPNTTKHVLLRYRAGTILGAQSKQHSFKKISIYQRRRNPFYLRVGEPIRGLHYAQPTQLTFPYVSHMAHSHIRIR